LYPRKNIYANAGVTNFLKDERSVKIMQKAKSFGIDIFENESLAKEFFNLELNESVNKELLKEFLALLKVSEKAIIRAQMSS